jgi:hypothetical protein
VVVVVVVACEVVVACVVVVANVEVVSGALVVDGIRVVVVIGVVVVVVVGINEDVVLCRVVDVAVRLQPATTRNKSIEHLRKFDRIQECNIGLSDAMFRRKTSHG